MFVEMKRRGNKPTPEQQAWHDRLQEEGYHVVVAYSAEEAFDAIWRYLEMAG